MNCRVVGLIFSIAVFLTSCQSEVESLPLVEFIAPEASSLKDKSFLVDVKAESPEGIQRVELYLNNVLVGSATTRPYQFTVNIIGYDAGDYQLKAVAYSSSGLSNESKITITITKASLPKPLELRVTKGEFGRKIVVSWNAVPGATSYEVYKQDNSTKAYNKLAVVDVTTFTDESISTPLTQYFYKVRPFNSPKEYGEFSDYDYGYTNGEPYDLLKSFGREGPALDELGFVVNLSYHDQIIYLVDDNNNRITKYSKDGVYLGVLESSIQNSISPLFFDDKILTVTNHVVNIRKGGETVLSFDTGIIGLRQITIDNEGFIYATSSYSHEVSKFDPNGNLVLKWGSKGDSPGQFNAPWGIAYFGDKIVVSNYYSKKVQFFSKAGAFIKEWSFDNTTHALFVKNDFLYIACGGYVAKTNLEGLIIEKIYGAFDLATSVAVDEQDNIIVTDPYQRKVYIYRKN